MSAFSITEAAKREIQRIFLQSACRDPVARLYERASAGSLFDEVTAELLRRKKTTEELEVLGHRRFEQVEHQLTSSLMVGACERAEMPSEHLHETDGITFVMSNEILEVLHDFCLIFEDDHFWLRSKDGVLHTLRSFANKR